MKAAKSMLGGARLGTLGLVSMAIVLVGLAVFASTTADLRDERPAGAPRHAQESGASMPAVLQAPSPPVSEPEVLPSAPVEPVGREALGRLGLHRIQLVFPDGVPVREVEVELAYQVGLPGLPQRLPGGPPLGGHSRTQRAGSRCPGPSHGQGLGPALSSCT